MKSQNLSTKNKKTLKKSSVSVVKVTEESDSKNSSDSDQEESNTDNSMEDIENEENIEENVEDSSENSSNNEIENEGNSLESSKNSSDEEVESEENIDAYNDKLSSGAEGDESDANENSDETNGTNDKSHANPHWADAMKRILNTKKPKRKKSIVLSKAKKLMDVVPKSKELSVPFEVQGKDGEIKKEIIKVEENITEQKNIKQKEQRIKNMGRNIRVKPSILDKDYERRLQKIATNGVVQLFNAVKQQQKEIEDRLVEAGPLERKREKALKSINKKTFLDVLMGGTNKLVDDDIKESIKDEESNSNKQDNEVWSVLRDDFVMGAKMKDWNKKNTSSEESSAPEEMDSD